MRQTIHAIGYKTGPQIGTFRGESIYDWIEDVGGWRYTFDGVMLDPVDILDEKSDGWWIYPGVFYRKLA